MLNKLLSIIIPAYNCEKYVSTLAEKYVSVKDDDIEFVFVNDGSKDETKKILQKYAEQDYRFKIIDKDNGGVSSARNVGIKNAEGMYIWFNDSDDLITDNAICEIKKLLCNGYDMLIFDFLGMKKDGFYYEKSIQDENEFALDSSANKYLVKKYLERKTTNSIWNIVLKKDVICKNNLSFNEKMTNGEDGIFFLEFADKISSLVYVKTPIYIYNKINESSATHNITEKALVSRVENKKTRDKYIKKYSMVFLKDSDNRAFVSDMFKTFFGIKKNKAVDKFRLEKCIKEAVLNEYLLEIFKNTNKLSFILKVFKTLFLQKNVKVIYLYVSFVCFCHSILKIRHLKNRNFKCKKAGV